MNNTDVKYNWTSMEQYGFVPLVQLLLLVILMLIARSSGFIVSRQPPLGWGVEIHVLKYKMTKYVL